MDVFKTNIQQFPDEKQDDMIVVKLLESESDSENASVPMTREDTNLEEGSSFPISDSEMEGEEQDEDKLVDETENQFVKETTEEYDDTSEDEIIIANISSSDEDDLEHDVIALKKKKKPKKRLQHINSALEVLLETEDYSSIKTSSSMENNQKRYVIQSDGSELHRCVTCGKEFGGSYHLDLHMRSHDRERKLYTCVVCGKQFGK
ncbi:uncharacterized protein LOC143230815 [Tachypleus tridentatus]|uniref:uncharacterized protein LOC143230815 n=1 Tax=Tachypleus tridentatus TaxID=6853 RepID=UPI003FD61206